MSGSCDVIVIFRIFASLEQSGGRIPDTVCKSYFFSNSNLLPYKNWKQY